MTYSIWTWTVFGITLLLLLLLNNQPQYSQEDLYFSFWNSSIKLVETLILSLLNVHVFPKQTQRSVFFLLSSVCVLLAIASTKSYLVSVCIGELFLKNKKFLFFKKFVQSSGSSQCAKSIGELFFKK